MIKLTCNVEDKWADVADATVEAYISKLPESERKRKPRTVGPLIPMALLALLRVLGREDLVTPELDREAQEVARRRPGPKPKPEARVSGLLFDDRPGQWISELAISNQPVLRIVEGKHELSLPRCPNVFAAFERASVLGWGMIPEVNDGVPGYRFLPPGTDLRPTVSAPPPLAIAQVGAWISEAMIRRSHWIVMSDGRVLEQTEEERARLVTDRRTWKPDGAILVAKAKCMKDYSNLIKREREAAESEELHEASKEALAELAREAHHRGWTTRQHMRGGHAGLLLIPPDVDLLCKMGTAMIPVAGTAAD